MKKPGDLFLDYSRRKLEQLAERIRTCLDQLEPEQVWQRNSEYENSIGNLVLHLCGNIRQWIGYGVAGQPDVRARDSEFAARSGVPAAELKGKITAAVNEAQAILSGLPESRLTETTQIQGYQLSVLEAIYHVVEHFSGHTGQIIYATKLITGRDLGFYRHLGEAGLHRQKVP